jgi:hypothetical protein
MHHHIVALVVMVTLELDAVPGKAAGDQPLDRLIGSPAR